VSYLQLSASLANSFIETLVTEQRDSVSTSVYRVSQEECARLREGVPYGKVYRYNPNANAPWHISNVTLHNDLRIPYATEVIRTYAKNHKNRTAQNNNQLIRDLFNQREIGRRLNRMWPEDLIR
jgi:hypothetical protein